MGRISHVMVLLGRRVEVVGVEEEVEEEMEVVVGKLGMEVEEMETVVVTIEHFARRD